jgi:osmotically-inducible protein OsmY
MKINEDLQRDVQEAIKWEPLLNAAEIGVTAKDGIITLTGVVDSYAKKSEAEKAAKNVVGVKAVVEKIQLQFGSCDKADDNQIATSILNSFNWNWKIANDNVKVKVEDGWVTLDGELQWNYQKEAAQNSATNIIGVKGVTNNIKIKSETHDEIEKKNIESAIARNWSINNLDIQVKVAGTKVILNGTVFSVYQKDEAARIAWNAPGVWNVDNEIVIESRD